MSRRTDASIDGFRDEKESLLLKCPKTVWKKGFWGKGLDDAIRNSAVMSGGGQVLYKGIETSSMHLLVIGNLMEQTDGLLKMINFEVSESKRIIQDLKNEVAATADIVHPELIAQVKHLRDNRMSVVSEITQILNQLKEIRKFFLESGYETEIARLREFTNLCKELKAMKESGVLDALADVAIRLAVKEESK